MTLTNFRKTSLFFRDVSEMFQCKEVCPMQDNKSNMKLNSKKRSDNKSHALESETDSLSRRDFLRHAALAGTVLSTLGIPLTTQAQSLYAASEFDYLSDDTSSQNGDTLITTTPKRTPVLVNQVGYLPGEAKRAIVPAMESMDGSTFHIVDHDTANVRHTGHLTYNTEEANLAHGHYSHHHYAEFGNFGEAGTYRVTLPDGSSSAPFTIDKKAFVPIVPLIMRYFDAQSCAVGRGCHRDDGIATGGPRSGQPFNASGGWHDAGDYIKFVETTSYATAVLLYACDTFPHLLPHIPRGSKPILPPLLAQAKVGLDWLLKMHPAPDEFYYQVGDESDHNAWRLPETDSPLASKNWKPRQVFYGIGANLAGRTAAAFALAARLYAPYDDDFSSRCLSAAVSVYRLGLQNPKVLSTLPFDFYPESTWKDDMAWGAAEVYKATQIDDYLTQAVEFAHQAGAANDQTSVYNTHALAHSTLFPLVGDEDKEKLRGYLRTDADVARYRAENPYGLATPYVWGTAECAAGAALNCLLYAKVMNVGDASVYTTIAQRQRDYILGCNQFDTSFLIGAGTNYPRHPHHQIANLAGQELTGALVGGPVDPGVFSSQRIKLSVFDRAMVAHPICPADAPDQLAVYHDSVQDYVTNEAAIDYTAKFLLLSAFYQPEKPVHSRRGKAALPKAASHE